LAAHQSATSVKTPNQADPKDVRSWHIADVQEQKQIITVLFRLD
jgi:hypothetical protein